MIGKYIEIIFYFEVRLVQVVYDIVQKLYEIIVLEIKIHFTDICLSLLLKRKFGLSKKSQNTLRKLGQTTDMKPCYRTADDVI